MILSWSVVTALESFSHHTSTERDSTLGKHLPVPSAPGEIGLLGPAGLEMLPCSQNLVELFFLVRGVQSMLVYTQEVFSLTLL